jgi:nucleotide-binding universal stress UspA family protein
MTSPTQHPTQHPTQSTTIREAAVDIESTVEPLRRGELVVGVDGSPASRSALRFAAGEAHLHGDTLVVLTATVGAALAGAVTGAATAPIEGMSSVMTGLMAPVVHTALHHFPAPVDLAGDLARTMVGQELGAAPQVTVRVEPYDGRPAKALVERSVSADLVVVGARGQGGLGFGSVADQVRRHASCTVVVVPGAAAPADAADAAPRPVVVGVDGSPGARRALRFAAREARLRGTGLVVVAAYHPSEQVGSEDRADAHEPPEPDPQPARTRAGIEQLIAEEPEAATIEADLEVEPGHPANVLLDTARRIDASLLVVGSRGLGGFAGLLLGSVGEAVSRHAQCPVAVVRP